MHQQAVAISEFNSTKFSDFVSSFRIYTFKEKSILDLDPEGNIELVFQLKGNFSQRTYGEQKWSERPLNFVGGLHSKSFQIKNSDENSKLISIRFKPLGTRHFIQDKLNLFKNEVIDLNAVNPIVNKIDLEEITADGIANRLDQFLSDSFHYFDKNAVDIALNIISSSNGFISIRDVCQKLNISESYLRRTFNEQIGTSPKEYAKIMRINSIIKTLKENKHSSLTKLSYRLGYYDQSHFIKDFKSVTGRSPRQYTIK